MFTINDNGTQLIEKLNALEAKVGSNSGEDMPQSLGELYCIRKAEEMVEVSQYIRNTLKVPNGNKAAGDTMKGLPYSSTRVEDTLVPMHVSYETYLTAMSDAQSYAYTKSPNLGAYGYLYYGCVCGVFVCWCLGIKNIRHRNRDMFDIPGLVTVDTQDAQAMRIGYIVNCAKNNITHTRICIGVTRENGVVTSLRMAESTDPVCKITEYTAADFNATLSDYTIMRYERLDENTYDPSNSPYNTIFCNRNIMPKKGNRSNWLDSEDVIIDVLDAASYTSYVLYKNGVAASPVALGSGTTINLGHLPYGKYRMVLTDGTNESSPVEWIVVDMQMSAEALSGGKVRFTFSSANATAMAAHWCRADYMANIVVDVEDADRANGYIDTELRQTPSQCSGISGYTNSQYEEYHAYYATSQNPIYPRMTFKTEYGIIKTKQWSTPIYYVD